MKKIAGILIAGLLPLLMHGQLVVNSNYLVIAGGRQSSPSYLVLNDSASSGITYNGGWIISENEFNMVQWNIRQSTGIFTVPFGYSTAQYLPVSLNINSSPGTGAGNIKFSTYHTAALNSVAEPSDVNNLTPFILPGSPSNTDNSYNIVDRFYVIDANTGYTTKPAPDNITFSYISGTANSEVASPNTLTESRMMAQRFNSTTNTWSDWFGEGCTNAIYNNTGIVQTGPVPAIDMYRSWSLWDNTMPLPMKVAGTNASSGCHGNGTASATIYGGKPPYTYLWSNGGTTSSISSLSGGTYTVTANDANGCNSTSSVTITQPTSFSVTASVIANIACFGENTGNASASPSGGASPYTYSWSNGTSTVSTSNPTGAILSAGSYTVTATDANGCAAMAAISITQPVRFIYVSAGIESNVTCNGSYNGSASATPVGGNSPYTYKWSNASTTVSTSQTPNTLSAGTYTVTVTDNCGVSNTAKATITQPGALRDSAKTITNLECNGGSGGSITLGAKGGTFPYSYRWSTGGTMVTVTGLSSGTYSVVVTDKNGCTNTVTGITITQPAAIRDSVASITYPECNGGKGSATIGVKGGTSPYSYTWTGGLSTTATATNISSRTYTVTIKDKNSCTSTLIFTLTQPNAIHDTMISALKANVFCRGGSNGSATVGVKYGISPYTYTWSNGQTTSTATGLSAGVYSVTVSDNNGCSSSVASVTITQPALALNDSISSSTCSNNLIKATIGVKGGTSPYTYAWSPGGGTKATMSNLSPGTYTITVTDAHGCNNTFSKNLVCGGVIKDEKDADDNQPSCCDGPDNITLYPNPNNGQFTVSIKNYARPNESLGRELGITNSVEIYNMLGQKVYSQFNNQTPIFNINITSQPNGIYLIRILDKDGQVVTQKKIVKTQ